MSDMPEPQFLIVDWLAELVAEKNGATFIFTLLPMAEGNQADRHLAPMGIPLDEMKRLRDTLESLIRSAESGAGQSELRAH